MFLSKRDNSLLAGALAGAAAYYYESRQGPPCAKKFAGGAQSALAAIAGALQNGAEDFSLGLTAIDDWMVEAFSLGTVNPETSAAVYSWWEGLSPEQQQTVMQSEAGGLVQCALAETASQGFSAAEAALLAAAVGVAVYFIAEAVQS